MTYTVRVMTAEEIALAVQWAADEGWNPGNCDADCFYPTDPNGFFIGELNGEPVGCISAVAYKNSFGFVGFYIITPKHRGKGYGLKLWNHAMAYLKGRNIGLDGVVAQQDNYQKSGFKLAYRNIRYEGIIPGKPSSKLIPLPKTHLNQISAYDQYLFPEDRTGFWQRWTGQPNAVTLGKLEDNTLRGFGVIRSCRVGYKIGPLNADCPSTAEEILHALAAHAQNEPVYLDVPEINPAAVKLAESHNMKTVFETARMYTKSVPKVDLNKIYGITTFELG